MSTIIYPECQNDDIRKKEIDLTSPFSKKEIRVRKDLISDESKGITVCETCRDGKVVIAKGNRFDRIKAET